MIKTINIRIITYDFFYFKNYLVFLPFITNKVITLPLYQAGNIKSSNG